MLTRHLDGSWGGSLASDLRQQVEDLRRGGPEFREFAEQVEKWADRAADLEAVAAAAGTESPDEANKLADDAGRWRDLDEDIEDDLEGDPEKIGSWLGDALESLTGDGGRSFVALLDAAEDVNKILERILDKLGLDFHLPPRGAKKRMEEVEVKIDALLAAKRGSE